MTPPQKDQPEDRKASDTESWIEAAIEIIDAEEEPLAGFIAACVEQGAQGSAEQGFLDIPDPEEASSCEECGKPTKLSIYFPGSLGVEEIVNILEEANKQTAVLSPGFRARLLGCRHLHREDWAVNWRHTFPPERVSEHFWVIPPWDDSPSLPENAVPLVLEPGPAFGTGKHATTQHCLQFLEEIVQTRASQSIQSFLDAGCGSGILCIAASRLGVKTVFGVDTDQDAIGAARRNLALNNLSGRVYLANAPVQCCRGRFQIIAANLTDKILLEVTDQICGLLADDGLCLVAGILEPKGKEITRAFQESGMAVLAEKVDPEEGWNSFIFSRTGSL